MVLQKVIGYFLLNVVIYKLAEYQRIVLIFYLFN